MRRRRCQKGVGADSCDGCSCLGSCSGVEEARSHWWTWCMRRRKSVLLEGLSLCQMFLRNGGGAMGNVWSHRSVAGQVLAMALGVGVGVAAAVHYTALRYSNTVAY